MIVKMAVKDTPTLLGNKLKQYYHKVIKNINSNNNHYIFYDSFLLLILFLVLLIVSVFYEG